jgi:hypothetical protein
MMGAGVCCGIFEAYVFFVLLLSFLLPYYINLTIVFHLGCNVFMLNWLNRYIFFFSFFQKFPREGPSDHTLRFNTGDTPKTTSHLKTGVEPTLESRVYQIYFTPEYGKCPAILEQRNMTTADM